MLTKFLKLAEEGFLHTQETAVIEIFTTYTI